MGIFSWFKAHTEVVIQVLVYTRAAASDYDDWENVYGIKDGVLSI